MFPFHWGKKRQRRGLYCKVWYHKTTTRLSSLILCTSSVNKKKLSIHLDNQCSNLPLSAQLFVSNKQRSLGHGQITAGLSSNDKWSLDADRKQDACNNDIVANGKRVSHKPKTAKQILLSFKIQISVKIQITASDTTNSKQATRK